MINQAKVMAIEKNPRYAIDTCSILKMKDTYPIDVFPSLWEAIGDLFNRKIIISTEEVFEELCAQEDLMKKWAENNAESFLEISDEVQVKVSEILTSHSNIIDLKKKKSSADPFLIAQAIISNCIVVTEENKSGGPPKIKIPNVCEDYGIECIKFLDILKREHYSL